MSNILSNSVSGLQAFQRALATTSHNISNVNTEGFSRQRTEFETRPPQEQANGVIGTGVQTATVTRLFDQNREDALRTASSGFEEQDALATFNGRIDNLLADKEAGLSPALQGFFDSLQDVASDPASSSARGVAVAEAESLVSRFDLLDRRFRDLDAEVNDQLEREVGEINQLSESIAGLNREIRESEGRTGQPANDLLDRRDLEVRRLSEKLGTSTVEESGGAVNVFVGNGQPLVVGNSANELGVERNEFDPGRNEVVFAGSSGNQTITRSLTGGSIGGVLEFRDEVLTPARNELGQLATEFSGAMNRQQALGLQQNGERGNPMFGVGEARVLPSDRNSDGVTGTPEVEVLDAGAGQLTGDDFRLEFVEDGAGDLTFQVQNRTTGEVTEAAAGEDVLEVDGLRFDISGVDDPEVGDRFGIQPTRDAVVAMESLLRNPGEIAAASPVRGGEVTGPGGEAVNRGDGVIEDIALTDPDAEPLSEDVRLIFDPDAGGFEVQVFDPDEDAFVTLEDDDGDPVVLAFDPAQDSAGVTFSGADLEDLDADFETVGLDADDNPLDGVEFTLAGNPAEGDGFQLETNTDAIGDNTNAQALAGIADERILADGRDTPQEFFSRMVGDIGTQTLRAQSARDAQESLLRQAEADREELSGVNLEEEAANLLRFQQGFQAAARAASVADDLFQSLLGAVQR